jgi:3-methyladenine DNA glycosylase AlkD
VTETTVAEVMTELAALEDPRARAVNERHGDDHGVNLGALRALAKRLKTQQDLARGRSNGPSWTACCARRAPPRCTTGW